MKSASTVIATRIETLVAEFMEIQSIGFSNLTRAISLENKLFSEEYHVAKIS